MGTEGGTEEGHQRNFRGDENVLYVDCGVDFMTANNCENPSNLHLIKREFYFV